MHRSIAQIYHFVSINQSIRKVQIDALVFHEEYFTILVSDGSAIHGGEKKDIYEVNIHLQYLNIHSLSKDADLGRR